MASHRSKAHMGVVSLGKVCEDLLHIRKKRSKLVDRGKRLKETRLGVVGLVSNSSLLNRDVGNTKLGIPNFGKQIIVPSFSVYLPFYFLIHNCSSTLYIVMCFIA
jgi:hypothetical protein